MMGLKKYEVAERLDLSAGSFTRGLRSQKWLSARIAEISSILEVKHTDLLVDPEEHNWLSPLERACGKAEKTGFSVPVGCTIRLLSWLSKWELALVAPPVVPPQDGDLVILVLTIESEDNELIGRLYSDKNDSNRWIINAGDQRKPQSVDKTKTKSISVVITTLGGQAWGER